MTLVSRSIRIFALLAVFITLSGCGKSKVLDMRNAEYSNGRIYARSANTPFTGLLTNAPPSAAPALQAAQSLLVNPIAQMRVVETYLVYGLCDIEMKDGIPDGKAICRTTNNNEVTSQFNFREGKVSGKAALTQQMISGSRLTGTLVAATFKDGRLDGTLEAFSPQTEKLIYHQELEDGIAEGKMVQYSPDGKTVIYRATLRGGLKDGVEEGFDAETGKLNGKAEWKTGKLDGVLQRWDQAGNLVTDQRYHEGVLTEDRLKSPAPNTTQMLTDALEGNSTSCVDAWTNAYHKEQGEDALISTAQLDEWAQWCAQGKRP